MDAASRAVSGGHRMKIGDRCFVRGYIDEIRKDTVIIRNAGGYFGTIPSEVITGELPSAQPEIIRCKDCKYITEHYDTDGNAPYWTCSEWDSGTDYDGFCHYAERRTDD